MITLPGDSGDPAVVLSASDILQQVAEKLDLKATQVEQALAEANITLKSPVPADRRLQVLRLQAQGTKHSGDAFFFEQVLSPGVWAIVHPDNSAGKTSLLEFLVWPLRGAPRDLPLDVRSWLRHLSLDILVAGRPVRIVLDIDPEEHPSLKARILAADTPEELLAADDGRLRPLGTASGVDETHRTIGAYMLDALRMGQTSLWQANGGADGEGAPQVHGWASYFGACYLNPGGDEILLGDVNAVGGLSARLLELFVDIPFSTVLTQLSSAEKREAKVSMQRTRRAEGDASARASDRENWRKERTRLAQEVEGVRATASRDVAPLLEAANLAASILRDCQSELAEAEQLAEESKSARVHAEQATLDARETWQARRVLGRLNPVCCPRCEEPIGQQRRQHERNEAACSVCSRPLPEVDEKTAEALLEALAAQLNRSLDAEQAAELSRRVAADAVADALSRHQAATAALHEVLATSQNHERLRSLELQVARLDGQLVATGIAITPTAAVPASGTVVQAVRETVREVVDESAKLLFPALDSQIVELATRFGVQNLDSVRLNRAGHVNAVKAGVATSFKKLSRGDRLRMRIATVIALLRVSASRGVATHPGLLLIDSVAAEEVAEAPARMLISELKTIAEEIPDLQIVFTTAQPELVDVLPAERQISSTGEHLF